LKASPREGEMEGGQTAAEYVPDIFEQLFREEPYALPIHDYMDSQVEVNAKMRTILVDWLVEVHTKYRLQQATLFLTINLIDRYLSRSVVLRKRLQLVGVVAMFIAAKFEEVDPPSACSLTYITDNAYTKEDIFALECTFLTALDFKVLVPTAAHFLDHLQRTNRCDPLHKELAQYILELGLLDIHMIQHRPSVLAASALFLSNEIMNRTPLWPTAVALASRRTRSSLKSCVEEFRELLDAAPRDTFQAIRKKYSRQHHLAVAKHLGGSSAIS